MTYNLRSGKRFVRLRAEFLDACIAEDMPCWMCGRSIAYGIPGVDDSFELDHYYSVSEHPEWVADPANFRASHRRCNRARGNGAPMVPIGRTSRQWL